MPTSFEDRAAAVLIGDDLRAGIAGILVWTGKFRPEDESDGGVHPVRVVDDFAAAVSVVLGGLRLTRDAARIRNSMWR